MIINLGASHEWQLWTVLAYLILGLIGGGSRALFLWLTDVLLGEAVYLGGFLAITLLVVTLMLARAAVRFLIK